MHASWNLALMIGLVVGCGSMVQEKHRSETEQGQLKLSKSSSTQEGLAVSSPDRQDCFTLYRGFMEVGQKFAPAIDLAKRNQQAGASAKLKQELEVARQKYLASLPENSCRWDKAALAQYAKDTASLDRGAKCDTAYAAFIAAHPQGNEENYFESYNAEQKDKSCPISNNALAGYMSRLGGRTEGKALAK